MSRAPHDDPGSVEQWPSYTYWTESAERRAQHWYICFCLMMSSAQDWMTGVALKESRNLNWAATASYYSTVHCGRLLCFIACGDFPTQHNKLRELFFEPRDEVHRANRQQPRNPYEFNWLWGFSGSRPHTDDHASPDDRGRSLLHYLRRLAPEHAKEVVDLCPRFAALGALRNDSNYESLLIAHEYAHDLVSEQFTHLSERALALAERAARLSRDMFLAYVERDARLESERPAFQAATAAYFYVRLRPAIASKVSGSGAAQDALQRFMDEAPLGDGGRDAVASWATIEEQISREFFNSKESLMQAFERKVAALA